MTNKGIKGITIEIGGETTGLDKALKDVNKQTFALQSELKQVERGLKFNPESVELLAQKQELLTESIQSTTQKLDQLKNAQSQVEAQFKSGDIGAEQFRAFKREIEKTENQLSHMKSELGKVNSGAPLKDLKKDAEQAGDSVGDLREELAGLAGALAAGGGLTGAVTQALDTSSLNAKIDVSFEVPPESVNAVKEAVKGVKTYGIDAEAALEGVRRQWALNKDASDASNQAVIKGGATIAASYAGIDFNELIQETNEIAKALNISNEEALGLTNSLLKAGFPPEQLDIIAEYGTQLQTAGYNAQEIQALFAAGIDTGTWNIDNLMDGLKEGRIRAAEFGQEVPKALQELTKGTDISAKQLQTWGKSVAKGGEEGSAAMTAIAQVLNGVDDETKKNLLGVQIFGTIYEDQGQNIIDTLINAQTATVDLKANQDLLNESTSKLDATPAVQLQQALSDLKIAMEPLMLVVADFVTKIANWVSQNPQLAATIVAVTTALGILIGIIMALSPVISVITALWPVLAAAIGVITAPVALVIAGITALIAIGVLLYKNWDEIKVKSVEVWTSISVWFSTTLELIKNTFSNAWDNIKTFTSNTWNNIKTSLSTIWESIISTADTIWNNLINGIKNIMNPITTFFDGLWKVVKNIFAGALLLIVNLVTGDFEALKTDSLAIWNNIKDGLRQMWEVIKSVFSAALSAVKSAVKSAWEGIKSTTSSLWNGIKETITTAWNNIKTTSTNLPEQIKNTVKTKFEALKTSVQEKMQVALEKVKEIWGKVMSFFEGIDLKQIGKDIIQGLINGIAEKAKDLQKKAKEIADSIKKTLKNVLDIHSPSRETAKIGQYVGEGLVVGMDSTKGIVSKAAADLAKAIKEQFDFSKKWIDDRKYYNQLSLTEELAAWERVQARYKKGTEERAQADREVYRLRKQISDDLTRVNDEYMTKVEAANKRLIEGEQKLTEEYEKAVTERSRALYSFAGLFDEITLKTDVSGQGLIDNLKSQVNTFSEWAENIHNLAKRGIDEGLLAELESMGPKAAAEIAALMTLTDDELKDYEGLWQEKNRLAKEKATEELTGLQEETKNKIQELRNQTSIDLTAYKDEWINKIKEIKSGTLTEYDFLNESMKTIGNETIQGLMDGLNEMKGPLMDMAREIADSLRFTIQSALDINSPSKETMWMGKMVGQGLIEGMEQSLNSISNISNKMAQAALPKIQQGNRDYSRTMNNTITISTTTNSNEVRETERMLRRLAFQF